jgi:hypothetical protein
MRARAIVLSLGLGLPALALAGQVAGCVFASADDCELTLGFGCKSAASATTSGISSSTGGGPAGSGGTGGASTASSGTGGKPECTDPSTCPAVPDGLCASLGHKTCVSGKCGVSYMPGDAPSKKYGTCKKMACSSNGVATEISDDTNVYDDGNPCTSESCSGGLLDEHPITTGSTCTVMTVPGFCETDPYSGIIACLQCDGNMPSTCAGLPNTYCAGGMCVPLHCKSGLKDSGETDIDCGGGACLKCGAGKNCLGPQDCASGVCPAGKCVAATCPDNVQNNDETDIDCGGSLQGCPRCPDTRKCIVSGDCVSGVCMSLAPGTPNTCQPPSCTDGVMNGDETGLDCGGVMSMCPPCGP